MEYIASIGAYDTGFKCLYPLYDYPIVIGSYRLLSIHFIMNSVGVILIEPIKFLKMPLLCPEQMVINHFRIVNRTIALITNEIQSFRYVTDVAHRLVIQAASVILHGCLTATDRIGRFELPFLEFAARFVCGTSSEYEKGGVRLNETILVAIISSLLPLIGTVITVLFSYNKTDENLKIAQAVTDTKIEELTREVRAHNNFAQRMPVVEEQIKVINHRISDLENDGK